MSKIHAFNWLPKGLSEITLSGNDSIELSKEFCRLLNLSTSVPLHWHEYIDELMVSNENTLQCVVLDDDDGFHLLSWHCANHATNKVSFIKWLIKLNPQNWDDLLMAVSTYYRVLQCSEVDMVTEMLSQTNSHHNSILDAVLKSTRGMLFWRQQYVDLLRMCNMSISQTEADEVIKKGILLNLPEELEILSKMRLWNGQLYLDMVQESNPCKLSNGIPFPITKHYHPAMKLYPHLNSIQH